MKIGLGSNNDALAIARRLGSTQRTLSDINERLTTGLRILKSSDDAAGLALAEELKNSRKVYTESIRNINSGVELFSVADSALENIDAILSGIQSIAAEASSESIGYEKRQALENELQGLLAEFSRIKSDTKYNQRELLSSPNQSVNIQTGTATNNNITGYLPDLVNQIEQSTPTGILDAATSQALTGTSADGVELFDINSDGYLDAITAGSGGASTGNISILLGDSSGTFSSFQTYSTGIIGYNISLADFNSDGKIDILGSGYTTPTNDGYALVYQGDGIGNFTLTQVITAESRYSYASETADLNNDGYADIITSGRTDGGTGEIRVRFGDGAGNFSGATIYVNESTITRDVKFGDIDGDGDLDMVSAGYTSGDGKVTIRLGNGTGVFGATTTYSADSFGTYSLELADVNNDNVLDIITGGQSDGAAASTAVLINNGSGTFQNAQIYTQAGQFNPIIKLADLDEDGNIDLVTTGNGGGVGNISVRYGDGTGTFGARTDYSVGTQANNLDIADINGDGAKDVISVAINAGAARLNINLGQIQQSILELADISVLSVDLATEAFEVSTVIKDSIDKERGAIDAFLSRLESTFKDSSTKSVDFRDAESRIRDYDSANKTSKITRLEIIADSATAVFAQANQDPGRVLTLIEASTSSESKKQK